MHFGSKTKMVSVIMRIEYSRTAFQKIINILWALIYIFRDIITIRKIMAEVNQYLSARKRLYLSDTAAYLIQPSVDCDFHLIFLNQFSGV